MATSFNSITDGVRAAGTLTRARFYNPMDSQKGEGGIERERGGGGGKTMMNPSSSRSEEGTTGSDGAADVGLHVEHAGCIIYQNIIYTACDADPLIFHIVGCQPRACVGV